MKKIIIILLISSLCNAQNDHQSEPEKKDRFTISVNSKPNAWLNDGPNFGIDMEHFNQHIYFGAGAYIFPNLNNIGYTQFHAVHGLNYVRKSLRTYIGGIGGFTLRENAPFMILGVEGGLEYYISDHIGVGLESSLLNRSAESEIYANKELIINGSIKLIYKWDR